MNDHDREALLRQAELAPLIFPTDQALALSGRGALPEEENAGHVAIIVFDTLEDWGPLDLDELVTMVADHAGDMTPGVDATYAEDLVSAIARGLWNAGFIVLGADGLMHLPDCKACLDGQGLPDGCGSPTMDACGACHGNGTERPDRSPRRPAEESPPLT